MVEDDAATRKLVEGYLELDGFTVASAASAAEARDVLASTHIDLVLLDMGLPDSRDLSFAADLVSRHEIPTIIVTANEGERVRVEGLELGVDDFLVKPFNPRELTARVRNVLRRRAPRHETGNDLLRLGDWLIDIERRLVRSTTGRDVSLTRAEFDLATALAKARGRVLSRDQLLDAVDSASRDPADRTIDVLVSRLRAKLEASPRRPEIILTVTGVGYRIAT